MRKYAIVNHWEYFLSFPAVESHDLKCLPTQVRLLTPRRGGSRTGPRADLWIPIRVSCAVEIGNSDRNAKLGLNIDQCFTMWPQYNHSAGSSAHFACNNWNEFSFSLSRLNSGGHGAHHWPSPKIGLKTAGIFLLLKEDSFCWKIFETEDHTKRIHDQIGHFRGETKIMFCAVAMDSFFPGLEFSRFSDRVRTLSTQQHIFNPPPKPLGILLFCLEWLVGTRPTPLIQAYLMDPPYFSPHSGKTKQDTEEIMDTTIHSWPPPLHLNPLLTSWPLRVNATRRPFCKMSILRGCFRILVEVQSNQDSDPKGDGTTSIFAQNYLHLNARGIQDFGFIEPHWTQAAHSKGWLPEAIQNGQTVFFSKRFMCVAFNGKLWMTHIAAWPESWPWPLDPP